MLVFLLLACDCHDESPFCKGGCSSSDLDLDQRSADVGWTPREMIEALTEDAFAVHLGVAPDELDGTFVVTWDGGPVEGSNCDNGNGIGLETGVTVSRDDGGYVGVGTAELDVTEPGDELYRLHVTVDGAWSEAVVASLAEPLPEGTQTLTLSGDLVSGSATAEFSTPDKVEGYSDGTWIRAE